MNDMELENRLEQLKETWKSAVCKDGDVISLMREAVENWTPYDMSEESGFVLTVGDGIATVSGLEHAAYGEILIFTGGIRGMVQDMKLDHIGCILFGDDRDICEGSPVYRTGKTAGVPVGSEFVGRVVDALANPIDGGDPIRAEGYYPVDSPAPGIIDRQSVNKPMETGLLAIDAMFPIGRGQRELIIGDRQTGKTTIALDTILNQKGKNVVCIYVAIGQKASSVAQLTQTLKKHDAMRYSVVCQLPFSTEKIFMKSTVAMGD